VGLGVGDQPLMMSGSGSGQLDSSLQRATGNIHRRGNRRPKRLPFGPGSELGHISS
jgi:hypothetical protein